MANLSGSEGGWWNNAGVMSWSSTSDTSSILDQALAGVAAAAACAAAVTIVIAEQMGDDGDGDIDPSTAEAAQSVIRLLKSITDSIRGHSREDTIGPGEYGRKAIDRMYECENLDDARMTALRDLFTLDENNALTYTAIISDNVRKCWIQKRLKEMGFPDLDACAE